MKTIKIELKGLSPLLMHSTRSVNPLDPLNIELKKLTEKRKKTEEDYRKISDLEWLLSLYWDDNIGLYIPAENIERCVQNAGKNKRKGAAFERGFSCVDMQIPLDIGEKLTKDEMFKDFRFRDVRSMVVDRKRIMRTRARFNMWKCSFLAMYDESVLNFRDVVEALDYAGKYVGLCDSRPKYGKFAATITGVD